MSPHCRDMWAPSTSNATALAKPNTISLLEAVEKEVVHNELVFSALGLIGRFRGVWPSLSALHKWIVDHWEPIVDDSVQIYLHARGFFVLVFQTMEDRNKILGGCQWCWEDSNPLMLKLWHLNFNPESESFDCSPMWIRLPNLPLQYWFDSCFEAIGNSLGKLLLTDDGSLNLLHTNFVCILVEMDTSMDLPLVISISTSKGSWLQSVDYEGISFRCRRCFKIGHNVDSCAKRLAGGLVGVNEGGFQEGCSSFQVAKGGVQKMEDGPSSQGGLNVGMVEGIQPENQCWDSKGLVGMDMQNLKSLEDAKIMDGLR
ncbi:uncharacterized protein LOC131038386 [Cryptomeria japonica]|uniref:uncharacterized protein LOC131038386 n=1 Tax=Cryptomeria japonica TaxID=3369 RepID=UPI0027DA6597|nr:uncharacterized protein LOC131038386 [Cryptomeria japonica]